MARADNTSPTHRSRPLNQRSEETEGSQITGSGKLGQGLSRLAFNLKGLTAHALEKHGKSEGTSFGAKMKGAFKKTDKSVRGILTRLEKNVANSDHKEIDKDIEILEAKLKDTTSGAFKSKAKGDLEDIVALVRNEQLLADLGINMDDVHTCTHKEAVALMKTNTSSYLVRDTSNKGLGFYYKQEGGGIHTPKLVMNMKDSVTIQDGHTLLSAKVPPTNEQLLADLGINMDDVHTCTHKDAIALMNTNSDSYLVRTTRSKGLALYYHKKEDSKIHTPKLVMNMKDSVPIQEGHTPLSAKADATSTEPPTNEALLADLGINMNDVHACSNEKAIALMRTNTDSYLVRDTGQGLALYHHNEEDRSIHATSLTMNMKDSVTIQEGHTPLSAKADATDTQKAAPPPIPIRAPQSTSAKIEAIIPNPGKESFRDQVMEALKNDEQTQADSNIYGNEEAISLADMEDTDVLNNITAYLQKRAGKLEMADDDLTAIRIPFPKTYDLLLKEMNKSLTRGPTIKRRRPAGGGGAAKVIPTTRRPTARPTAAVATAKATAAKTRAQKADDWNAIATSTEEQIIDFETRLNVNTPEGEEPEIMDNHYEEFMGIGMSYPVDGPETWLAEVKSQRVGKFDKMRHKNIFSRPDSRPTGLTKTRENPEGFIGASVLKGLNTPNSTGYIATQGPTTKTVTDHWDMVWTQKSNKIVMLTNLNEKGKAKCEHYWPKENEDPREFGQEPNKITVTNTGEDKHPTYTIRTFTVERDDEKRTVRQYHYTAWPDHGAPKTTGAFLDFQKKVEEDEVKNPESVAGFVNPTTLNGEMVVHCSAGVGRTGTFIAIDHIKKCIDTGKPIPEPKALVQQMRADRTFMVQTAVQFRFIVQACQDYIDNLPADEPAAAEVIPTTRPTGGGGAAAEATPVDSGTSTPTPPLTPEEELSTLKKLSGDLVIKKSQNELLLQMNEGEFMFRMASNNKAMVQIRQGPSEKKPHSHKEIKIEGNRFVVTFGSDRITGTTLNDLADNLEQARIQDTAFKDVREDISRLLDVEDTTGDGPLPQTEV